MLLRQLIDLPNDHSRQRSAWQLAEPYARQAARVLDLGCGEGNSADQFKAWNAAIRWVGVDIENSPEVNARERADLEFHTFDGVNLPFPDNSFPLIFSHQVLEHVRQPVALLREA